MVLSETGLDNPLHVTLRENSAAWQSTLAKVLILVRVQDETNYPRPCSNAA